MRKKEKAKGEMEALRRSACWLVVLVDAAEEPAFPQNCLTFLLTFILYPLSLSFVFSLDLFLFSFILSLGAPNVRPCPQQPHLLYPLSFILYPLSFILVLACSPSTDAPPSDEGTVREQVEVSGSITEDAVWEDREGVRGDRRCDGGGGCYVDDPAGRGGKVCA